MKYFHLHHIQWDTDGDRKVAKQLPQEAHIMVADDFDPAEEAADVLSDRHGFCVFGLQFDEIKPLWIDRVYDEEKKRIPRKGWHDALTGNCECWMDYVAPGHDPHDPQFACLSDLHGQYAIWKGQRLPVRLVPQ